MVAPLIPIAVAGVGGTAVGGIIGSMLGGGKKSQTTTEQHASYETYRPTTSTSTSTSRVYSPSQIIQIESPGATITKKDKTTTKSDASARAMPMSYESGGAPSSGITEGTDMTMIALVGAAALIVYGVVSK